MTTHARKVVRARTGSRQRIRSDSAQRHLISPSLIKRPDWNERVFNVGMGMIKLVQEEREAENKAAELRSSSSTARDTINIKMVQGRSGWGVCFNKHHQSRSQPPSVRAATRCEFVYKAACIFRHKGCAVNWNYGTANSINFIQTLETASKGQVLHHCHRRVLSKMVQFIKSLH